MRQFLTKLWKTEANVEFNRETKNTLGFVTLVSGAGEKQKGEGNVHNGLRAKSGNVRKRSQARRHPRGEG